jgi:hypothetical protein
VTTPGSTLRGLVLAALLLLPLAPAVARRGVTAEAMAALACAAAGLVLLHAWLRRRVARPARVLALVLAVHATFLCSALPAPGGAAVGARFLAGVLALALATSAGMPGALRVCALLAPALLLAGEARMVPPPFMPLEGLWSPRVGLLYWNPALSGSALAMAVRAGRQRGESRRLGVSLGLTLLSFAVFAPPGPAADARFAAGLALAVAGWAWLLEAVHAAVKARPGLALVGAGALLVFWNLLFMQTYRIQAIPRDDTVAFSDVARGNAGLLVDAVGSPLAWPANWVFAARHGVAARHYETLTGRVLLAEGALEARLEMGAETAPGPFLDGFWSVRRPCGGRVCRELEGHAQVRLVLDRRESLRVGVVVAGEGDLFVALNGEGLGGLRLSPDLAEIGFPVPAHRFRRGVNVLELTRAAGGQARVASVVLGRGRP